MESSPVGTSDRSAVGLAAQFLRLVTVLKASLGKKDKRIQKILLVGHEKSDFS